MSGSCAIDIGARRARVRATETVKPAISRLQEWAVMGRLECSGAVLWGHRPALRDTHVAHTPIPLLSSPLSQSHRTVNPTLLLSCYSPPISISTQRLDPAKFSSFKLNIAYPQLNFIPKCSPLETISEISLLSDWSKRVPAPDIDIGGRAW